MNWNLLQNLRKHKDVYRKNKKPKSENSKELAKHKNIYKRPIKSYQVQRQNQYTLRRLALQMMDPLENKVSHLKKVAKFHKDQQMYHQRKWPMNKEMSIERA